MSLPSTSSPSCCADPFLRAHREQNFPNRLLYALCSQILSLALLGVPDGRLYAASPSEQTSSNGAHYRDPFPSTYRVAESPHTLIVNATIFDGAGNKLDRASILLSEGKIVSVGVQPDITAEMVVIDGNGRWVTPGLIDVHSHLGVSAPPYVPVELANLDIREDSDPNTAQVWAEHSVRTSDPGFVRARAGGVTTLQILPGSSNVFNGRGVVVKNVPATTVQGMKFPGARTAMKMACGENPKYTWGSKGRQPKSRMGVFATVREAFQAAREYRRSWAGFHADSTTPPKRDFRLEALAAVLDGELGVHIHCYRSEEMAIMLDIADEFGFSIAAFHHASEAYKIPRLLVSRDVCAVVWSEWWGFKFEAFDNIRENAAFLEAAGACVALHSDSAITVQRLNIEMAKAVAAGRRAGVNIDPEVAIRWLSSNPAALLGIGDRVGTLAPGMNADVVLWSGDPFSIRTSADLVFIDGVVVFDRENVELSPVSDFELGQPGRTGRYRE